jgi:SulP family sulfate permease
MFVPKLITCLREGYSLGSLRRDALAGLTVAIVALPLAMAIAIASGTTPDKGLFTAIIAGFLISALGGSRHQIGGPTAAFVIVVYGVIQQHGYEGLVIATLMAGAMLVLLGIFKLGTLIKHIPYAVVVGFTAGIALTIFSTQVKDFFGLQMQQVPADFLHRWAEYALAWRSFDLLTTAIALITLGVILALRRWRPTWPAMLIAIVIATALVQAFGLPVETIGSRFGAIPNTLPMPELPRGITVARLYELLPSAIAIALLAGIESLLSCVIADRMTGRQHKSNIELIGPGHRQYRRGPVRRPARHRRAGAHRHQYPRRRADAGLGHPACRLPAAVHVAAGATGRHGAAGRAGRHAGGGGLGHERGRQAEGIPPRAARRSGGAGADLCADRAG